MEDQSTPRTDPSPAQMRQDLPGLRAAVERMGTPVKEVRKLVAREGEAQEYTVITQGTGDKIGSALREKYGADQVEVARTDYVGPQVGKQLRVDGILAVVYAIGMILIYVGFRFDFRFSPGVVIALVHDAIITLGFFLVSRHEFNLTSVTVILTVVGYSVNDTIVIYDRIRENTKKHKSPHTTGTSGLEAYTDPVVLAAGQAHVSQFAYEGVTHLPTAGGGSVQVMKFTAGSFRCTTYSCSAPLSSIGVPT